MTTTHQLIAKQTVGSAGASSITFSNIPQTYTDLKIVTSARATRSGTDISTTAGITFNDDNNTNYRDLMIEAGYGSTRSASGTSQTYIGRHDIPADNSTAYSFSNNEIYIPNYSGTTTKVVGIESMVEDNSSANYMYIAGGLWSLTAPITSITLTSLYTSTFDAYSTFYLYGISNSTTTQNTSTPYAIGGDLITSDVNYWYHTFLYSGTFTPLKELTCDYLVVAGGAGAGSYGGGGGAGGLRSTVGATGGGGALETPLTLSAQPYTVTIGAGGAGGTSSAAQSGSAKGVAGGNSVFATITSVGGGSGLGFNETTSSLGNGGSGGGGIDAPSSSTYKDGGTGTINQGFAGGRGYRTNSGYNAGGGGGGAGSLGFNGGGSGSSPVKGAGGSGVGTAISGSYVTYASGGSGMQESGSDSAGANGTANRGIGGDSSVGVGANRQAGGNGGSGVVVVRYAK